MTAGTIVLLRHGRTAWNVGKRLQGQSDIPLDEVGRWQAGEAAAALARRVRADAVVTSDLVRAVDTARAYADLIGADVVPDKRLRERAFGLWEGLTGAEVEQRWPEQYRVWHGGGESDGVPPEGESRRATADRVAGVITEHAEGLESRQTLLVVSHGASITLALTALLGLDPVRWRGLVGLDNAHWSELRRMRGDLTPAWRIGAHNMGPDFDPHEWHQGPGPEASLDEPGPAEEPSEHPSSDLVPGPKSA